MENYRDQLKAAGKQVRAIGTQIATVIGANVQTVTGTASGSVIARLSPASLEVRFRKIAGIVLDNESLMAASLPVSRDFNPEIKSLQTVMVDIVKTGEYLTMLGDDLAMIGDAAAERHFGDRMLATELEQLQHHVEWVGGAITRMAVDALEKEGGSDGKA